MIVSGFGYTRRLLEHLQRGTTGTIAACCNWPSMPRKPNVRRSWPRRFQRICCTAGSAPSASPGRYRPGPMVVCTIRRAAGCIHRRCAMAGCATKHSLLRIMTCWNCARSMSNGKPGTVNDCSPAHPVVVLAGAAEIQRFSRECRAAAQTHSRANHSPCANPAKPGTAHRGLCRRLCRPGTSGRTHPGRQFRFQQRRPDSDHRRTLGNLAMLEEISHDLVTRLQADQLDPESLQGRAAFRCTSPDYLPIVGPLADTAGLRPGLCGIGQGRPAGAGRRMPMARRSYTSTAATARAG
jgi:tRNA 5-methylaminomethyl-2-thiouridine biosynthesis bifunctional protein